MDFDILSIQKFFVGIGYFILSYVQGAFNQYKQLGAGIASNIGQPDKTEPIALVFFGLSVIFLYSFIRKWFNPAKNVLAAVAVVIIVGALVAVLFFRVV